MSLADELYRETILDHYHHPRNQGVITDPTVRAEGLNPLCGDECTVYLKLDGQGIKDVKLEAHGCSINMASGSMMTEAVIGKTLDDAAMVTRTIKDMMLGKSEDVDLPEELEDLESLKGVKKYPVRIKCALLPWNTLIEAMERAGEAAAGEREEG